MCFGGGGQQSNPATIIMPDTNAYDDQFQMQKMLMEQQMRNNSMLMQQQLQSALDRKRDLMDRITTEKVTQAKAPEVVEEKAEERIKVIMAPAQNLVPQPQAADINMGRERGASRESDVNKKLGGAKKSGKSGLRISRNAGSASGAGVGLTISSGD